MDFKVLSYSKDRTIKSEQTTPVSKSNSPNVIDIELWSKGKANQMNVRFELEFLLSIK